MSDQLRKDGTSSSQDDSVESFGETASVLQDDGSGIQKDNQNVSDCVEAVEKESKDEQEREHRNRKRAAGKKSKDKQETEHHDPKRPLLDTVTPADESSSTDDHGPKCPLPTNQTLSVSVQAAGKKSKDEREIEHRNRAAGKDSKHEQETEYPSGKRPLLSTVATAGKSSSTNNLPRYEGLPCSMIEKEKLEAYKTESEKLEAYKTESEKMATENPPRSQMGESVCVKRRNVQVVGNGYIEKINGCYYPIVKGYQTVIKRDRISEVGTEVGNPRESYSVPEVFPIGLSGKSVLIEQGENFTSSEITTARNCRLVSANGSYFLAKQGDLSIQQSEGNPEQQPEDLSIQQAESYPEQQAESYPEQQAEEILEIDEKSYILTEAASEYYHVIEIDGELYATKGEKDSNMITSGSRVTGESPLVPQVGQFFFIEHEEHYRQARVIARNCKALCIKSSCAEVFKIRGEYWFSYGTVCSVENKTGLSKLKKRAAGGSAEQKGKSALTTLTDGSHPIIELPYFFLVYAGEIINVSPAQNQELSGEIFFLESNFELVQNLENSSRAGEAPGESIRGLLVKEGETKESTEGKVEERKD